MHGLANRSIQCFIRDTYGDAHWGEIARRSELETGGFEAMLTYDDALTDVVLVAASEVLSKPADMLLEDVGTYLVSHPNTEAVRRLLRFGGETFLEFLHSLDDLPDRARLAVPDLTLPNLELLVGEEGQLELHVTDAHPGYGLVLVGVLRAMADDFGALVFLDHAQPDKGRTIIRISLLDVEFAKGRSFTLARPASGGAEVRG